MTRPTCRPAGWCLLAAVVLAGIWGGSRASSDDSTRDPYHAARVRMVMKELDGEGITHEGVLDAMKKVPRHLFVRPEYIKQAYEDMVLPIGYKQTISPPYIVAFMTQLLDPKPTDRVLEIGTGSGYQAAVLALLVKEVYTIEIVEPLGKQAEERLRELGYANVKVKVGDGYRGWPEHAPFDKIIVTCSPEKVPQPLVEQLRDGGKMIVPLGERFQQVFSLFEKQQGKLVHTRLVPTYFVPMTGRAEELREKTPDPGRPRLLNGGFEQQVDGQLECWFWKRPPEIVRQGAPEGKSYVRFTNREPGRTRSLFQALGVDGGQILKLRFHLWVKAENARAGERPEEQPSLIVGFSDDEGPVGVAILGPWQGTFDWRRVSKTVEVPPRTRRVVLRLGLNGGTGTLCVDDVRMVPIR